MKKALIVVVLIIVSVIVGLSTVIVIDYMMDGLFVLTTRNVSSDTFIGLGGEPVRVITVNDTVYEIWN